MIKSALLDLRRAATQGFAGSLVSLLLGLGATLLGLSFPALVGVAVSAIVLLIAFTVWNYVRLRSRTRQIDQAWQVIALDRSRYDHVHTLVSTFDRLVPPAKDVRPSAIITLLQHLAGVTTVRLVMSPDASGRETASERVAALSAWLGANLGRPVELSMLDVRVPDGSFDERVSKQLSHAFEGLKQLPGLCVDVTAGTKPMSITMMRAAEEAELPVTYLPQSPRGPKDPTFHGITVLSDPPGLFAGEGAGG